MKQKIVIRDQPPGIFFNLLASIAIIVCLILLYQAFFTSDFTNDHGWKRWSVLLVSGLCIFTIGIRPIATQQLLIDLNKNTYKKRIQSRTCRHRRMEKITTTRLHLNIQTAFKKW